MVKVKSTYRGILFSPSPIPHHSPSMVNGDSENKIRPSIVVLLASCSWLHVCTYVHNSIDYFRRRKTDGRTLIIRTCNKHGKRKGLICWWIQEREMENHPVYAYVCSKYRTRKSLHAVFAICFANVPHFFISKLKDRCKNKVSLEMDF